MRQVVSEYTATNEAEASLASFQRPLRAENLSPRTVETYSESVRQFARFLEAQGTTERAQGARGGLRGEPTGAVEACCGQQSV